MIRFYYHPTPNPAKVALFLEEVKLPYEIVPIDTAKGEQHTAEFRAINPNGKVPVIVDTDGPGGVKTRVFDSTAILLYLGDKTGQLMGSGDQDHQTRNGCGARTAEGLATGSRHR
jgi:GSH-dependent disulfide-bond oxidoreductase